MYSGSTSSSTGVHVSAFLVAYATVWTMYAAEVPQERPGPCARHSEQACADAMPWQHGHLGLHVDSGSSTSATSSGTFAWGQALLGFQTAGQGFVGR
jgi:hypothetical protein